MTATTRRGGQAATIVTIVAAVLGTGAATTIAQASPAVSSTVVATVPSTVDYADAVIRAWGRGDRTTTARLATATVTSRLFTYSSPGGVHWRRVLAEGTAGTEYATYHDDARGGYVTLGVSSVVLSNGGGHAAYTVRFSQARPVDAAGYADLLVRAWGRGDRVAADRYGTAGVVQALFSYSSPGGGFWRRTAVQGAAGTVYVTYHDDARGGYLTVGVNDWAEQDGQFHAVYTARFSR
jgi:hypothetical protein